MTKMLRQSLPKIVCATLTALFCVSCDDKSYYMDPLPNVVVPSQMAFKTGLPVVFIDTPDNQAVLDKENWITETDMRVYSPQGDEIYSGKTAVRGRGNATWNFPKKPYSLKLNKKSEIMDMPSAKRWVLLANWADRTLLRNDVAFEVARHTSLEWTPHGTPVELVFNQQYRGSYYLCEKIQVHQNRLNIVEMTSDDVDETSVTGGYLMEIDQYYDEPNKFRSATFNLPYQFRNPDEETLTTEQFAYMQKYINDFEASLSDDDAVLRGDYEKWIDPDAFIDWWIVSELCNNEEVSRPKSVYLYKQRNGRLKMGPIWDFDYSAFTPRDEIYVAELFPYMKRLFMNPIFRQRASNRWNELKNELTVVIPRYIDEQAVRLRASDRLNIRMWPISVDLNGDEALTFDEAIERMKQSFLLKAGVIDQFLDSQEYFSQESK